MTAIDISSLPEHVQELLQDLTEENRKLKQKVNELTAEALQDGLTGLLNQRGFKRALERSISFCERYDLTACLIYIDLNDFKPINDTHGHAAGDIVLKTIAERMSRHVRASDVVARIGGDEFVVLLWQVSPAIAEWRANMLVETLCNDKITVSPGVDVMVGASAGVTVVTPKDDPAELLVRADRAMYQMKAKKRELSTIGA
ncbi:MAG: GGDEF domain-containing protein [Pseudomonadota bacterium]